VEISNHIKHIEHCAKCNNLRWTAGGVSSLCPYGRRWPGANSGRLRSICKLHNTTLCTPQLVRNLLQVGHVSNLNPLWSVFLNELKITGHLLTQIQHNIQRQESWHCTTVAWIPVADVRSCTKTPYDATSFANWHHKVNFLVRTYLMGTYQP